MEYKKQFNMAIELLRILSTLAVVTIHITTRTIEYYKFDLINIPLTIFFNQISRFAVPIFFIISGFALNISCGVNENYFIYLKKRVNKILTPYIFWSIIYYFFIYWKNRDVNFIRSLLLGDASYQLYFIPSLIIFYIVFPVLRKLIEKYKLKLMLMLLIVELILLYFDYYKLGLNLIDPIRISILNFFPFCFGIYFSNNIDTMNYFFKKYKYLALVLIFLLITAVFYEGFFGYLNSNNYLYLYSQWRPSVLIYSVLLFGLLYSQFNFRQINEKYIKKISSLSFFVYFIHVIVLELLFYLQPKISSIGIIYFLFVSFASFGVAAFIHKIPYLKKLTG